MKYAIKGIIEELHPELASGQHLPRFGKVMAAREAPPAGRVATDYRPYYAVDVQVLDEHGKPDTNYPVLYDVPLPVQGAGHDSGHFSFPEDGAQVEVAFGYGSPNKPFIRSVLPSGKSLPAVARGEQLWQKNAEQLQRVTADGSWERRTDQGIIDDSLTRSVSALKNDEHFTQSNRTIEADERLKVGGTWRLDAMGNIVLTSGGRFDIGALNAINLTSKTGQRLAAPLTWLGSESENVLGLLSELMAQVIDLSNQLAAHTHGGVQTGAGTTAAPVQSGQIAGVGSDTGGIKSRLDGIKS